MQIEVTMTMTVNEEALAEHDGENILLPNDVNDWETFDDISEAYVYEIAEVESVSITVLEDES